MLLTVLCAGETAIDGYDYYNENALLEYSSESYGFTGVDTQKGSAVPVGYMGGLARVYKEGGALCLEGSWEYNSLKASTWGFFTPGGIARKCGGANYYAKDMSRAWNGYEYDTYSSFNTPYPHI